MNKITYKDGVVIVHHNPKKDAFWQGFAQGFGAIGFMFRDEPVVKIRKTEVLTGQEGFDSDRNAIAADMWKSVKVVARDLR